MAPTRMVTPQKALRGRSTPMKVAKKHYVLGTPMLGPDHKMAVFANGCFWGSEKGIWRLPYGIISTAVGYAGGFTPNPTYQEVCSGKTGHTEAVQVVYDPSLISFADILRWMWEAHDPCSGMGQGNDRGTQYRSAFYWFDDEQKALILASKGAYEAALGRTITTECAAASDYDKYGGCFFYAEDQHQQYLAKPGARPYCSAKPRCVSLPPFESWAPEELQARHAPKLPEAFWAVHAPKPHCVVRAPDAPIQWPPGEGTEETRGMRGGSRPPKGHRYPLLCDASIMSPKAHGTSPTPVQAELRWGCPRALADRICNFNRHGAERSGSWLGPSSTFSRDEVVAVVRGRSSVCCGLFVSTSLSFERPEGASETIDFRDSNTGRVLFTAPVGRSFHAFVAESRAHGWPSFRDAEVNWERVRCLRNGECVSLDGTHLGHNLPDRRGNRYCINLVSVAGKEPGSREARKASPMPHAENGPEQP